MGVRRVRSYLAGMGRISAIRAPRSCRICSLPGTGKLKHYGLAATFFANYASISCNRGNARCSSAAISMSCVTQVQKRDFRNWDLRTLTVAGNFYALDF